MRAMVEIVCIQWTCRNICIQPNRWYFR